MAEDQGQIREAIAEARAGISEAMETLARKADVKGRIADGVKEKGEDLMTHVSASADNLLTKLDSLGEQARTALPGPAAPAADAAITQARRQLEAVSKDPARQKMVAFAMVAVLLLVLLRLRSKGD